PCMFTHRLTIQLHHTDAYSILYFPNQFQFCQVVFQEWLAAVGLPLPIDRASGTFLCVVVHAEADYAAPIHIGDVLTIEYRVHRIGESSFVNEMTMRNQRGNDVGAARITYCTVDPKNGIKM